MLAGIAYRPTPRLRTGLNAATPVRMALLSVVCLAAGLAQAQPTEAVPAVRPRVLLVPAQETTLVAQTVSQITRLAGELGSSFKRGATLVRFDCSELDAQQGIAEADVASAQTTVNAKLRLQELQAAGDVEVAIARAALQKARAELQLATVRLNQCRVVAPFNGRVVKRHVARYQGVRIGDPLLDIVSSGPLKLRLNVPSRWLVWLRVDAPFGITVDETGKPYRARVSAINARVDAVSQSIEIEAAIEGEHPELLAGMSGSADFSAARAP